MNAAAETVAPTVAGTPFAGGFYVRRYFIGIEAFALIVAPKADEIEALPWHDSKAMVDGALTYNDGLANTAAMAAAGSVLAQRVRGLRIGGFDDWHIGDRLQMLAIYHELQSAPAFAPGCAEAFERDWYWTSTQYAGIVAYAWCQSFDNGYQYDDRKSYELRCRPVRRLKI